MTSNSFCRHLSNGFRIFIKNGRVTWLPCCYWQGEEIAFDHLQSRRSAINISTPWHHQECARCGNEEVYKTPNGYREVSHRIIPKMDQQKAGWIDIQADITCNGGCLICGPWNSSFWQTELARHKEWSIVPVERDLKTLVDSVFAQVDVSELRLLQFLGGEPFLSDVDQWAMAHIEHPEQCVLKYTTNGSVYPQSDRIDSWRRFKEVQINLSIDGIGAKFEYLRYPLQWNRVESHIQRYLNEREINFSFHINHTLTPLNIWYYGEFIAWVNATFPATRFRGIHAHTAYGVMSVAATSQRVRDMVLDRYGSNHMLTQMLAANPLTANDFWPWIEKWDQRRGTAWTRVFKEIV